MSGIIGLTTGEVGRGYGECTASIIGMQKPEGSRIIVIVGGSMAKAWNTIGAELLKSDAEWLMLLNDDHIYPPDTIARLLAHDVDMVTGLYLHRRFPFNPVLYGKLKEVNGFENYLHYLPTNDDHGLVEIVGCGDGCVLIRRRVLEALPIPIWRMTKYEPDLQSTDLIFCEAVRKAGFRIWADLDLVVGHMIMAPIFPGIVRGERRVIMMQQEGKVALALPTGAPKGE